MASDQSEMKDLKSKVDPQYDDDMKMDHEEALPLNILPQDELFKAMGVDPTSYHRNQRTSVIVPTQRRHFEFKIEASSEVTPTASDTASDTPSQAVSNNNLTAPILRRRSRKSVFLCFHYSFSYICVLLLY